MNLNVNVKPVLTLTQFKRDVNTSTLVLNDFHTLEKGRDGFAYRAARIIAYMTVAYPQEGLSSHELFRLREVLTAKPSPGQLKRLRSSRGSITKVLWDKFGMVFAPNEGNKDVWLGSNNPDDLARYAENQHTRAACQLGLARSRAVKVKNMNLTFSNPELESKIEDIIADANKLLPPLKVVASLTGRFQCESDGEVAE